MPKRFIVSANVTFLSSKDSTDHIKFLIARTESILYSIDIHQFNWILNGYFIRASYIYYNSNVNRILYMSVMS